MSMLKAAKGTTFCQVWKNIVDFGKRERYSGWEVQTYDLHSELRLCVLLIQKWMSLVVLIVTGEERVRFSSGMTEAHVGG